MQALKTVLKSGKIYFPLTFFDEMAGFKDMFLKINIQLCACWISVTPLLQAVDLYGRLHEVYRWVAPWKGDNVPSKVRTSKAYLSFS